MHSVRKLQLISITHQEFSSQHEVVKGENFNPSLSTHLIDSKSLKMTSYICMCVCVCVKTHFYPERTNSIRTITI